MLATIRWTVFFTLLTITTAEISSTNPEYIGPQFVKEGDPIQIMCRTTHHSFPQWSKNGTKNGDIRFENISHTIPTDDEMRIYVTIEKANSYHAGTYRCHKFSDTFHKVTVLSEIETSGDVHEGVLSIILGKTFRMSCNVTKTSDDDDPIPIEWLFEDNLITEDDRIKIHNHNNTLVIHKATVDDCGLYMCRANVTDVYLNDTIMVQARPMIEPRLDKSRNQIEGDTLNLTCVSAGVPKPDIYWLKDGVNVTELNISRLEVHYYAHNSSNLVIKELEENDRANYTCVAHNSVNTTSSSILVRVKDKLAALWPFLGIVAEVAVLCTIIFIYEKRRAKQEFEESDTDQSPDTKNASENKDVRQRK